MNHKKVAEINYVLERRKKNGAVNCSLIALLYTCYVCVENDETGWNISTKKLIFYLCLLYVCKSPVFFLSFFTTLDYQCYCKKDYNSTNLSIIHKSILKTKI